MAQLGLCYSYLLMWKPGFIYSHTSRVTGPLDLSKDAQLTDLPQPRLASALANLSAGHGIIKYTTLC